jgi:preprotein translocase subunit YajC
VVIAIYLVILVAAFYFLIVRPQRRQAMIRRQLIAAVKVGDEIVTNGGVYGTVLAIDDETLDVEIAPGIVIKLARGAVAARIGSPDDVASDEDVDEDDLEDEDEEALEHEDGEDEDADEDDAERGGRPSTERGDDAPS